MFYKEVDAGSWACSDTQGLGTIVPISSRGLSQNDRTSFFSKTAASEKFLNEMSDIKLADGEIPIHVNALMASEWASANRKGDCFSEQTCKDWHHHFVDDGKVYIYHRNNDPDNNFGKVASSCYNDNMHRVELLLVANGNKKSAKKNKGHVVPDEFLSKLEKNAAVPFSMGTHIDYDVCMICGNKSRTIAEYCTEDNCVNPKTGEYHPGCKHGMMKVAADGTIQCVDNVGPRFFDISFVAVPADRTAYGYRASYLEKNKESKTASFNDLVPEDYLAISATDAVPQSYRSEMTGMLQKLAHLEQKYTDLDHPDRTLGYGLYVLDDDIVLGKKLASMLPDDRLGGLRMLAASGVLLSPEAFAVSLGFDKVSGLDIRENSKTIYTDTLRKYAGLGDSIPSSVLYAMDHARFSKAASYYLPEEGLHDFSCTLPKLASSVSAGILRCASLTDDYKADNIHKAMFHDIAEAYALYKAAALCRFPAKEADFGACVAVLQTIV
jgi:hypothetical protein